MRAIPRLFARLRFFLAALEGFQKTESGADQCFGFAATIACCLAGNRLVQLTSSNGISCESLAPRKALPLIVVGHNSVWLEFVDVFEQGLATSLSLLQPLLGLFRALQESQVVPSRGSGPSTRAWLRSVRLQPRTGTRKGT